MNKYFNRHCWQTAVCIVVFGLLLKILPVLVMASTLLPDDKQVQKIAKKYGADAANRIQQWRELILLNNNNSKSESEKLELTTFSEWELNGNLSVELQQAVAVVGKQAGIISARATETAAHYDRLGSLIGLGIVALAAVFFLVIGLMVLLFVNEEDGRKAARLGDAALQPGD